VKSPTQICVSRWDPKGRPGAGLEPRVQEEFGSCNPKSARNPGNVDDRDVLLAPFDRGHVGPVDGRKVRELFLGDAALQASASNRHSKGSQNGVASIAWRGCWHRPQYWRYDADNTTDDITQNIAF